MHLFDTYSKFYDMFVSTNLDISQYYKVGFIKNEIEIMNILSEIHRLLSILNEETLDVYVCAVTLARWEATRKNKNIRDVFSTICAGCIVKDSYKLQMNINQYDCDGCPIKTCLYGYKCKKNNETDFEYLYKNDSHNFDYKYFSRRIVLDYLFMDLERESRKVNLLHEALMIKRKIEADSRKMSNG